MTGDETLILFLSCIFKFQSVYCILLAYLLTEASFFLKRLPENVAKHIEILKIASLQFILRYNYFA